MIALLALIVVGPEQLPGVMRKAGEVANQLRSMSSSLRTEFMNGIDQADVTKWGKGTLNDPVVPRGFSEHVATAAESADPTSPVAETDEAAAATADEVVSGVDEASS